MTSAHFFARLLALVVLCLLVLPGTNLLAASANPVPLVNQPLVPSSVPPGSPNLTLTVTGSGFVSNSVVNWNGLPLSTSFVSVDKLQAQVPASNLASAGTAAATVSTPSPGGGTSNAVPFTITSPTTSLTFATSKRTVGMAPAGLVVADFNNDGKADLAVVNQNDPDPACYPGGGFGTISILLGNGDGTFSKKTMCFQGEGRGTAGPLLVAGDFNGDGNADLVASYVGVGMSFQRFLGNGDGTFTGSFQGNGSLDYISGPVAGDFNGDGNLDLAFTADNTGYDTVFDLLGNGDGTFTPGAGFSQYLHIGSLAVGDFNNDGILDLAVSGNQGTTILLGSGDGAFVLAPSQPPITVGGAVTTGDFDGDGNLDLAIAAGSNLTILKGNGDGTFAVVSGEPPSSGSGLVTTADLNGDGKLDLIFTGSNTISIFLGNGDGTFQPALNETVGNSPAAIGIGDFNGDGRLDLAVTNSSDNTISILRQTLAAPKVSVTLTSSQNPSLVDQSVTYNAAVSASPFIVTGSVSFKQGATVLGTVPLTNGQAAFTTTFTKSGTFSIVASYSGDQNYKTKNSTAVKQIVNKYTTSTALASNPNPSAHGQPVTFTAKVSSSGPLPTGKIVFKNGTIVLGSANLVNGVATLTKANLPSGSLSITATYNGDAASGTSTSAVLVQVVN